MEIIDFRMVDSLNQNNITSGHFPSKPLVEKIHIQQHVNQLLHKHLFTIAVVISIYYALLAYVHYVSLPDTMRISMSCIAGVSSIILFLLATIQWLNWIPVHSAHFVVALIGKVALFNCVMHLLFSQDPVQSTNIALYLLAVGCFYFSPFYFFLSTSVGILSWIAVVKYLGPHPVWSQMGFMHFSAVTISFLVFYTRYCSYCQLIQTAEHESQINKQLDQEIETRKSVEVLLRHAKDEAESANQAKSQFLANMSHEIRTPMHAIIGMTDIVLSTQLTTDQENCLITVKKSCSSLLNIINDILDISKIESGKMVLMNAPFHLHESVRSTVDTLQVQALKKQNMISMVIDELVPDLLEGDETRFRQILINLVGNAIKFSNQSKIQIHLSLKESKVSSCIISCSIYDQGVGIPQEKQDKIFEKFEQADNSLTRNFEGTGLGLAITKQLVELMDGSISLESPWKHPVTGELHKGCAVHFNVVLNYVHHLEIIDDISTSLIKQSTYTSIKNYLAGKKVLLVEDNELNLLVAENIIMKNGASVIITNNGIEGIERFKEQSFDLVLMDVQMPIMDGFQATREIRKYEQKNGNHTPIIAMTAHAHEDDKKKCIECGMDDYISKPFHAADFIQIIQKYLTV